MWELHLVAMLFLTMPAVAADNAACTLCHSMSFPPVNREVVCGACHLPFAGSHPYHQIGANCGAACHPGWGTSLLFATPRYDISGDGFATLDSKSAPAEVLHAIHSEARWPATADTLESACSSCHAIAACNACHTVPITSTHGLHSSVGTEAIAAVEPWVGTTGYGVVGHDQSQRTAALRESQCGVIECHDLAATQAARPRLTEDFNHAAGGNPDDPAAVNASVETSGTWRSRYGARYTGGRMSFNNVGGSSMSISFSGGRIELISDRDPYRGQADVFIDDVYIETIDCYFAVTEAQSVVFGRDVAAGTHVIEVRPKGVGNSSARGAFVVIDAFRVYPARQESATPLCTDCHHPMRTHGAVHEADPNYSASVLRPPYGPYYNIKCLSCHRSNLLANHGTDYTNCLMCHQPAGPRSSFTAWDKTCQTGDCHPGTTAPHPATTILHKHNLVGTGQQPDAVCYGCHGGAGPELHQCGSPVGCHVNAVGPATTIDFRPPTTVVSKISEDPVTWQLLATDVGDGVVATYYSFDGAPFALYGAAEHASGLVNPADGELPYEHTLRYYSVDGAGNVEPIRIEAYDISDTTPPVITFSGLNPTGTSLIARTLTLSAVDPKVNGLNRGVASIKTEVYCYSGVYGNTTLYPLPWWTTMVCPTYPLDGTWDSTRTIAGLEGPAMALNAPTGRITYRTLATWSKPNVIEFKIRYSAIDYAGNESTPVESWVSIDNQVPVTTPASAGTYRWKLNAVDSPAGIGSTYYSFDGAGFAVYTAADHTAGIVNTQPGGTDPGAHTLRYYSVDGLGNTEAIKTLDYTIP